MRKRRVIFIGREDYQKCLDSGWILMYRPMGSSLFRVFVPVPYRKDAALMLLLREHCSFHAGIFYIRATDQELIDGLGSEIFSLECYQFIVVSPDEKYFGIEKEKLNAN